MTSVAIRFVAGRYHATPWGRHVNEAAVSWPPEPVRILRALIATWHLKADKKQWSEETLSSLIDHLASMTPHFALPPATHSHSRAYVPVIEGSSEKPALVFDAFLTLDEDQPLTISWPGLELPENETELLRHLLEMIGYLGRAESWCVAELVESENILVNCTPVNEESVQDGEPVDVLTPMSPDRYAEWRKEALLALDESGSKGRKREQVASTIPEHLVDLLQVDTGEFQQAGWSHVPGMTTVTYLRDRGWSSGFSRVPSTSAELHAVRFALSGRPLPRVEDTLRIGELTRASLMGRAKKVLGEEAIPTWLSGRDAKGPVEGHLHAFFLPEDADGDGWIDHVLVIAAEPMPHIREVSRTFRKMYTHKGEEWRVMLEWESSEANIEAPSTLLRPKGSTRWRSVTPYLHPWHRKKNFGYEEQIRRELAERGLPALEHLTHVPVISIHGTERHPVHFHRFRRRGGLRQPDRLGAFFEVELAAPVTGPLALGYACHYGLGLFKPVDG